MASVRMLRGARERTGVVMVVSLVMFLLIETYSGDLRGVGEDLPVDIKTSTHRDFPLPSEINLGEKDLRQEKDLSSYYLTANELVPGTLDDMVEDGRVDMVKVIHETEERLKNRDIEERLSKKMEDMKLKELKARMSSLIRRPPVDGKSPGFSYSWGNDLNYTESLESLRHPQLVEPGQVRSKGQDTIDLGLIVINLKKSHNLEPKFAWKVTKMLRSLMLHSSGTPLHFVIVTDQKSVSAVGIFFAHFVSQQLSERVIFRTSWRWRRSRTPPTINFSFVDMENIRNIDPRFIDTMKNCSMSKDSEDKDKYASDLFYISPLYHR